MEDLIEGAMTFQEVTENIRVAVQSFFLEDQSEPDDGQYFWAYRVKISNEGSRAIQLLERHWIITDGNGQVEEFTGEGVVGEQPTIPPGEAFVYTSGTPLNTPSGFMKGFYDLVAEDGTPMRAAIPVFSLDCPYMNAHIH